MSVQVSTLSNGLRVATLSMPGIETAAVGLSIDAGSRFETAATNGVAHMLEHMVFKGTKSRSARDIAEQIEAVGGHLNAYTSRDNTVFYARVLGADVDLGLDLVSDMITAPLFDASELTKEREVILQELGQALDTPDDLVFDQLQAVAYPDQPLGRSILGTSETINTISGEDIRKWQAQHYAAGSIILTAAGKVDHSALLALAEQRLSHLPQGKCPAPVAAHYVGGEVREERALEQVHISLAVPGACYTDADYYAQMLFSAMLGGGMSSRLFQSVREDHGLVYSIFSSLSPYADGGLFSLYLGTGADVAGKAIGLTLSEWKRSIGDVTEAELQRAKAQAKAGLFMSLESCSALSESFGRQLLIFDRVIPTADIIARIDGCTLADVKAAGAKLIAGKLSLATVGPSASVPDVATCAAMLA
jgi:predicted Zn-dependent peptidase